MPSTIMVHAATSLGLVGLLFAANGSTTVDVPFDADGLSLMLVPVLAPVVSALKRGRGRPRKFSVPSRALTLTLPESVLEALAAIDPDPSRAIVQLASRRTKNGKAAAELAVYGDQAVITVRRTPALERRTGIHLVPLPDGRALISFDHPRTIAELELAIYDALDNDALGDDEREVFAAICSILKEARRSEHVTLHRRNIIILASQRPSR